MTQPNLDKIVDRIQKLLSLASNNPNEAEAQAAMAKAQEMLEAHNLDMAQIGKTAAGRPRKDQKQKGGLYGWQRKLWQNVAELNFCKYWSIKGLERGSTYEHRLLGSHANVLSTQLMAEYLQQAIERLAQTWAKERGYGSVFVREAIAYREGMASRIAERLQELRRVKMEEAERQKREDAARSKHPASAGTALTLVDVKANEEDLNNDYMMGLPEGTTTQRRLEEQARQAAWRAEQAEKQRLHEEKMATDPEYREAEETKQAKLQADNDTWWAEWQKKVDKQEKRRAKNPPKERYRKATPEEERAMMVEFREGRAKGSEVNLDQQIDTEARKAVK